MSTTNFGTGTFYITGNAQGASSAAAQANGVLASLSNTVNNNWWGIKNLGLAFAALPTAIAAGAGMAVRSAIQWQDSMFALSRATGSSAEAVEAIGDQILEVAKTTPLATTALADLAATGAQLGITDNALGSFAKTMGLLISSTNLTEANVGDFARVINVMQVPEEQFEQFANTLLEVGRNTAATESEILNISKRMSGAAAVAGLTSDQLLGIGAAMISLGPCAEAGGTAFNKTIADMIRAVSAGGDSVKTFAQVSGHSVEEFTNLFREDASHAFADFVTGLARLKGGGEGAVQALDALGITEARQQQALLQLSQGTLDVGNKQRDLNAILGFTSNAWNDSNALAEIAAQKAKTLSGQIQLLRNALFSAGATLGKYVIPVLGFAVQRFLDFLSGVQVLPGPLKVLIAALIGTVTILSGLAAVALIVGPRLLIAYDAFLRITTGAGLASGAMGGVGGAASGSVGGVGALTIAVENLNLALLGTNRAVVNAVSNMSILGASAAGASTGVAANAVKSTTALTGLAGLMPKLAKGAGYVGLALTALSVVTTILGNKQRKAAADAAVLLQANDGLTKIMREQGAVTGAQSTKWLTNSGAYRVAAESARLLGFNLAALQRIITGLGTSKDLDSLVSTVKKGGDEGKKFAKQVTDLATVYQKSAAASGLAGKKIADFGAAEAGAGKNTAEANKALKKQIDLLTQIAQAAIDFVDAEESQKQATLALQDAQEAYADALEQQANIGDAITNQERELAQARSDAAKAAKEVSAAEQAIGDAREIGIRRLEEAEFDLADARDRQTDALEKISDLEEKVAELRSGASTQELIKQTNALRDAELKLIKAHTTVGDAEFHLQQIREDGGSARDIADAEFALAEAKANQANATSDLADEQKKLDDLNSGKALLDAEKDLAKARRDSVRDARAVTDAEKDLQKARKAVADDSDYLAAQDDIAAAQGRVAAATEAVRKAQDELDDIRNGSLDREVAKAQLDLEGAIIAVAKANVEVQKQQALSNGLTWDAGDSARALGVELGKLTDLVPNEEARKRLESFVAALGKAPEIPDAPDESSGGGGGGNFDPGDFGLPTPEDVTNYADELSKRLAEVGKDVKKKGGFSIGNALSGALTGASTGAALGSVIPGFGTLGGAIAGAIIGGLIGGFGGGKVLNAVKKAFDFAKSGSVPVQIGKQILATVINPAFGIALAGVHFSESGIGKSLIGGFKNLFNIGEQHLAKFKSMADKTQREIQTAFEGGSQAMIRAFTNNGTISQQEVTKISGYVEHMRDVTIAATNDMADKRISKFQELVGKTGALSAEEMAGVVGNINKREESVASETNRANLILAEIQRLKDSGVTVTAQMVTDLIANFQTMRDQSIVLVTESTEKQKALLASLEEETGQISDKQKNKIIGDAKERHDKTIEAAQNAREGIIAEARKELEAGTLKKDLYDKIVADANTSRDGAVAAARDTADKTIEQARRLAGEVPPKAKEAFDGVKTAADDMHKEARDGGKFDIKSIGGFVIESLKGGLNAALPGLGTVLGKIGGFIKDHKGPKSVDLKMLTPAGQWIMQGLITGLENEERNLEKKLADIAGMFEDNLARNYVAGFTANAGSSSTARGMTAVSSALGAGSGSGTVINEGALHLQAITTADPVDIINHYVWANRVRRRGSVVRSKGAVTSGT